MSETRVPSGAVAVTVPPAGLMRISFRRSLSVTATRRGSGAGGPAGGGACGPAACGAGSTGTRGGGSTRVFVIHVPAATAAASATATTEPWITLDTPHLEE